ncbi:uncharacterized protein LOC132265097 [Phlebotomus argentipes]|uniref:uncharacterized protein LOC132265097 n=1 Tax=Phlebotomus argentipes TaxID=94469 RepID=UPI002892F9D2|nr:uncharacterized protein LOC132265097 [Phlebotomus argentipes]
MAEAFDLFANIDDLNDDSPPVSLPVTPLAMDDSSPSVAIFSPERRNNIVSVGQNLSSNTDRPMTKKEEQLMKRYQKKKEQIQKKMDKKKKTEMRREALMNLLTTSTPRNSPARQRRRRRNVRSSPVYEDCEDYITVGSPPDPQPSCSIDLTGNSTTISSVDLSSELDYEITIKLKWNGGFERIPYMHLKPFDALFQTLSQREKTDSRKILLSMNGTVVSPVDTPSSIGYSSADFISGCVAENILQSGKTKKAVKKLRAGIELKIQSDRWKRPIIITAGKQDTVQELLKKCAEELKCSTDEIFLRFDGETLGPALTLQDLEMEGGEILDCVFKKGTMK